MSSDPALRARKKGTETQPKAGAGKANASTSSIVKARDRPSSNGNGGWSSTSLLVCLAVIACTAGFVSWQTGYIDRLLTVKKKEWTPLPGYGEDAVVDFSADVPKRQAVVDAFKHAWLAYERDALGADEYHPISHKGTNLSEAGGIGYTIVDSIDTMQIMGLEEEYARARLWVEEKLDFERDGRFNTFELEFRYLSMLTDEEEYWRKAEQVMKMIKGAHLTTGLASIFMNPEDGRFVLSAIRLGSRGDSYYEYLLKQYIQTNMTEPVYQAMYDDAMNGVQAHLISKSYKAGLTYTSELIPERNSQGEISWRLAPKQDHLVCFFGGSLMLGAVTTGAVSFPVSVPPKPHELTEQGKRDWNVGRGRELVETCVKTHDTATGLSPEIVHFRISGDGLDGTLAPDDWYIKGARQGEAPPYDARYILRYASPPTLHLPNLSSFIAFRLTGDVRYRQQGWAIFQAIEKHCRVETGGYASVLNVDDVPVELEDKMETFLMSETLKYLYLLFDDASTLPLSEYVFNTEAHPFPIFHPTLRTGFS
ncbi:mannosyl-oligosaccharide alpha-1,2-mannosidase [Steccherinum ochraceum]|uniref:alpha-1,2-Mannosidase n=1 Tax=Steccherinum ochraceum TaxID=92696 RepID=A0A4R0RQP7_9APHY|nr:mannosyl-oligosaccharide alpha-1,2-mannosidase [Steccherinum ochraceum]